MRGCMRWAVLPALLASTMLGAADPALGTWKLNVAKSKFSPGPPLKSGTVVYEAVGDAIKRTGETVDANGVTTNMQYTASFDGKDYPVTGSPLFDSITTKRVNDNTAEATLKRDGKVVGNGRRVISKDGKSMTITVKATNAEGKQVNNVSVYEKQQ